MEKLTVKSKNRYRTENGKTCIDIRLRSPLQLFDLRDPAPFHERDLDEDAVQYLTAAAEDIPFSQPLKIAFSFSESTEKDPTQKEVIATAVQNHFDYEIDFLRLQMKRTRKKGMAFMVIGLTLLVICLTLSQIVNTFPDFLMKPVLYEGFLIGGWVAMWRPIDLLLFDWWPMMEKMKYLKKLASAEVLVDFLPL
ncbi:MAG: hypothetical protein IPJ69_03870 [Deltaproteobacteria bacterium]|nr:MAG: hypothetical protein IPJ69_03870 [Deltaproteobacteria bacterium]